MSKRLIAVVVAALLLAVVAGGAVAAGINGDFEGFPIVRVVVNGQQVQGDVPAINFHGRTMVPIRFVSEALGADVGWDPHTWTATVTDTYDRQAFLSFAQGWLDKTQGGILAVETERLKGNSDAIAKAGEMRDLVNQLRTTLIDSKVDDDLVVLRDLLIQSVSLIQEMQLLTDEMIEARDQGGASRAAQLNDASKYLGERLTAINTQMEQVLATK